MLTIRGELSRAVREYWTRTVLTLCTRSRTGGAHEWALSGPSRVRLCVCMRMGGRKGSRGAL